MWPPYNLHIAASHSFPDYERVRGRLSQENFDRSLGTRTFDSLSLGLRLASCLIECLQAFPTENHWRARRLSLITRTIVWPSVAYHRRSRGKARKNEGKGWTNNTRRRASIFRFRNRVIMRGIWRQRTCRQCPIMRFDRCFVPSFLYFELYAISSIKLFRHQLYLYAWQSGPTRIFQYPVATYMRSIRSDL